MLAELQHSLKLSPTAHWNSFEQFRTSGANTLNSIIPGTVGTLHTKTGQYRILTESDFQRLLGIASDADRLQQGLSVVTRAVRLVQKHPHDSDTLELLIETATLLGSSATSLPTRSDFPPLAIEDIPTDSADEVTLLPNSITSGAIEPSLG
jgi:hypothetical protein